MSGAMIVNGLALIGACTCLYWLFRVLSAFLRWIQPPEDAIAVPAERTASATAAVPPDDVARDDIVVIAAAVHAMLSGHRIVHITDTRRGVMWSAEGRWMHQTSHNPH